MNYSRRGLSSSAEFHSGNCRRGEKQHRAVSCAARCHPVARRTAVKDESIVITFHFAVAVYYGTINEADVELMEVSAGHFLLPPLTPAAPAIIT